VSLSRAALLVCLAAGALPQAPPQSGAGQTPPVSPSTPPQTAPQSPTPADAATPATPVIDKNAPEMTTKDAPAFFKTRVDMVSVPVVVRDAKGRAIGAYTKENFQVFDKGKPQEIVRFAVEKTGSQAAKAAKTVDTPIEGEPPLPPDIPERFVAYLFDDMHLAMEDLIRARDAAGRQLSKLAKTDRAAIYTTSGQNVVDFTDDVDKLQADLLLLRNRSISNMGPARQCPDISYYMADMMINKNDPQSNNLATQETVACMGLPANQAQSALTQAQAMAQQVLAVGSQETHVTLTVLKDAVRRMAAIPGQRIIVLISPGFVTLTEYQPDKSDILDKAIKSSVVINSLDARGLWVDPMIDASQSGGAATVAFQILKQSYDRFAASAQADVLSEMSAGTGGSIFQNNNDLDEGMRQLGGAPEYYYLLGFSPQNLKLDGSFHALKVTVKTVPQVSLNVQARKGYYAPKKASTAEETAKEEIEEALFSREELSELPVELHTQYFKASEKDATIAVVCRMDPKHIQFRKADGRNINVLTVVSAVFDRNGNFVSAIQKTVDIKMKDDTLARLMTAGVMTLKTNFSVQPGSYMIRLVVRDSEGQLMSAQNGAVMIQ
jgi:VWFA-related protein